MTRQYARVFKLIPPVTSVLAIVIIALSITTMTNDRAISERILNYYDQHNILSYEQENFREYLSRKLTIDREGSASYLDHIDKLIANSDDQALILEIISNRSFFSYLEVDGAFFMTPRSYSTWKNAREQHINPLIMQLSRQRFGLASDQYRLADFFTYSFLESKGLLLFINMLLLVSVGTFLEYMIGKGKFLSLWFFGSFTYGALYTVTHNVNHTLLTGSSGPLSLVTGIAIAKLLADWQRDTIIQSIWQKRLKWFLFGLLLFIGLKLGYEFVFIQDLSWRFLLSQVSVYLIGIGLYYLIKPLIEIENKQSEQKSLSELDRLKRIGWSKAMDDISNLNFQRAQERLVQLLEDYPSDTDLVAQLYRLAKLDGTSETYWDCSRMLIETAVERNSHELAALLFNDIQRNAASKELARQRLDPTHYHKLMMIFVRHGDMEKAENSFLFLELAGHVDIIKDACTLLMQEYKHRQNLSKSRQYEMLLERL